MGRQLSTIVIFLVSHLIYYLFIFERDRRVFKRKIYLRVKKKRKLGTLQELVGILFYCPNSVLYFESE